jgi:uncharacterized membrane protein YfcA
MEPLTIAGALIGAFLNKVLPELLLTVLLVLLLSFTADNTLRKAIKMYMKESKLLRMSTGQRADGSRESELTRMARNETTDEAGNEEGAEKLLDNMEQQEAEDGDENKEEAAAAVDEARPPPRPKNALDEELEQIVEDERNVPYANLSILATMFVVVLSINLLKGGGAFRSPLGIKCGSTSFWIANFLMLAWILIISAFVRQYLLQKYRAKQRTGYNYVEGDIQWDERATIVYPGVCCFAGFFAGMFGVGTSMGSYKLLWCGQHVVLSDISIVFLADSYP